MTPFTRTELDRLGTSEHRLRRWLADGLVRRVLTGVYCSADLPDSLDLRAQCAALVLPSYAVVCDRSAAWLLGIDVHDPDERFTVPRLEVVVRPDRFAPRRGGIRAGVRELTGDEITVRNGVRVTTPARTAIDLACLRGRWRALATLDAFMRTCGLTHVDLARGLIRHAGRRGVTQARELVPLATPLAESAGESWVRGAILDERLPAPEPQVEIFEHGRLVARLDLGYRHLRVAVEYDGEEFHGEQDREHDEARRAWLRDHGWHVVVVRKGQLSGAARQEWLDELAGVLGERSAVAKRRYARRPEPWTRTS